jgi:hypothetical protein
MKKDKKEKKLKKLSDLTVDDCEKVIEAMKIVYEFDQCSKKFLDDTINVLNQQIYNCNKQKKIRSNRKIDKLKDKTKKIDTTKKMK